MNRDPERKVFKRWELVALTLAFVVVASSLVGLAVSIDLRDAAHHAEEKFDNVHRTLAQRFNSIEGVLTSLASMHHARGELRPHELTALSRQLLQSYPFIEALIKIDRIGADRRDDFEASMRDRGFPQFRVTEMTSDGVWVPAPQGEVVWPIETVQPLEPQLARLLGFNVVADADLSTAMDQAIDSDEVKFLKAEGLPVLGHGLLAVRALYLGHLPPSTIDSRRAQVSGLLAAYLDIEALFQDIVHQFDGSSLRLADHDPLQASSAVLYEHDQIDAAWSHRLFAPLVFAHALSINDQHVVLRQTVQPGIEAVRVWLVLLLLILAGLVAAFALSAIRAHRIRQFEQDDNMARHLFHQRRFRDYAEIASDWFWEMGEDLRFSYVSDRFSEATGAKPATFIGRTQQELMAEIDATLDQQTTETDRQNHMATLCAHQPFRDFRHARRDPGGRINYLSMSGMPVHDDEGIFKGYRGTGQNITDKVKSETALRAAKEEAESANRAKSEFLANMSHEIRTPINGVLGMAELLTSTELTDKQRRFADNILSSGRALLGIVNDVLDFSKIEAGKLDLEDAPFDLRSLIEDIGQQFAGAAHRKKLELICVVPDDVPATVRGDAQRLRQALTNLVGNALKFTKGGEISIWVVETTEEPSGSALFRFEVRDTGIGIAPEARSRIFDSFTQADSSTSRQYGGTGLGLAITQKLVELMGGHIGFDSEPEKGTTFWFTVRLHQEPTAAHRDHATAGALEDLRVLVLDDNATNRGSLERQLSRCCALVAGAANGESALQELRPAAAAGRPYDVVLVDRHLPDMDGLTFARRLRADGAPTTTRLVLLGSMMVDQDADDWRSAGFAATLTKPVRRDDLMGCLASLSSSPDQPAAVSEEADAQGRARRSLGATVLVAEDNPVNQELVREMLEALGCRVTVVEDGDRAIEAVRCQRFDLVLMDCQMPRRDGFEATTEIRVREAAAGSTARLPIVALTANAMTGDRERCVAAGMDDYLSKPFRRDDLTTLLERWLPCRGEHGFRQSEPDTDKPTSGEGQTIELDRKRLLALRALDKGGSNDLLRRAIGKFTASSAQLVGQMVESIGTGDAAELARAAHSLKSSSATLGVDSLATQCRELEAMTRDGHVPDEAAQRVEQIQRSYQLALQALERESASA